jgi:pimeloyl-ACP methyl ester carboxylesterase
MDTSRVVDIGTETADAQSRFANNSPGASGFAALYDRAVEDLLDEPVRETWVETAAGRTHVLTAGDPAAPPVVVFQGGNVTSPVTLAWVQALADDYYLVAPDTPGQPGKSTSPEPAEFGPWFVDVLNGLGIDRAAMLGISHGGGVLLEAAVYAPERIEAAVLVAPAGFGSPLSLALARIVVPSLAYRLVPRRKLLSWALTPMFTQPLRRVEDVTVRTIGQALRTGDLRAGFPGPDDLENLHSFGAPTLLVLGEYDPFFPAGWTSRQAERSLPSLVDTITLAGEGHFLSPEGQTRTTNSIRAFLTAHLGATPGEQ